MADREREDLVVDASVATKWHLQDEEHVAPSLALLTRFAAGELELWAPEYIRYEVPSAITVATRGRAPRLTAELGQRAIEQFLALGIRTRDSSELILSASPLAHRYGCALYDALYLALAQQLGLPFVTADAKLYRLIRALPEVVWIGDYPPAHPT